MSKGNTMPCSQSRRWCWTSYSNDLKIDESKIDYTVYQKEVCPSTGKEHLQGYTVCKKKCSLKTMKSIIGDPKVHLESAKGNHRQCIEYCTKLASRAVGCAPVSIGNEACISQGKRSDLDEAIAFIKGNKCIKWLDLVEKWPGLCARYEKFLFETAEQFRNRIIKEDVGRKEMTNLVILTGKSGTGKTTYIKNEIKDVYWKNEKNKWWDGYNGQENVCINDFTNTGEIKMIDFLTLCDHAPYKLEIKGGTVELKAKNIYLTTNLTDEELMSGLREEHKKALERRIMWKKF